MMNKTNLDKKKKLLRSGAIGSGFISGVTLPFTASSRNIKKPHIKVMSKEGENEKTN